MSESHYSIHKASTGMCNMSLRFNIYTRICRAGHLLVLVVVLADDDDGHLADLVADEVVRSVTTSMAVGGSIANGPLASEGAGLVVDGKTELGGVALGEAEAVVAGTASHNFGGQARNGANLASNVGTVLAGELETSVLDAVVLADEEIADVDVLEVGRVGRSAAVSRVGATSCLRSRGGNGGGGEEGGDGKELHLVWYVDGRWVGCWKV
jgi:hypothetical protein